MKIVLQEAIKGELTIDKDMPQDYIDAVYEAVSNGYLKDTKTGYKLTKKGKNYLIGLRSPEILPKINAPIKHINKYHMGTFIVKIFRNDWIKLLITAILGLIIGTWFLVKLHIIK